jgi:hypothetical protein
LLLLLGGTISGDGGRSSSEGKSAISRGRRSGFGEGAAVVDISLVRSGPSIGGQVIFVTHVDADGLAAVVDEHYLGVAESIAGSARRNGNVFNADDIATDAKSLPSKIPAVIGDRVLRRESGSRFCTRLPRHLCTSRVAALRSGSGPTRKKEPTTPPPSKKFSVGRGSNQSRKNQKKGEFFHGGLAFNCR